jgi:hypothetical protein
MMIAIGFWIDDVVDEALAAPQEVVAPLTHGIKADLDSSKP